MTNTVKAKGHLRPNDYYVVPVTAMQLSYMTSF